MAVKNDFSIPPGHSIPAGALPASRAVRRHLAHACQALFRRRRYAVFWLCALLIGIWSIGPFAWVVITSIKLDRDLATLPPILPTQPTLEHYISIFSDRPFHRYIINSAITATVTTLLCLLFGSLSGYVLGRMRFPGRLPLLFAILGASMFPQIVVVAPIYVILRRLELLNTFWALIIPYNTFALPLGIWILTSYFQSIPAELEDAAQVDGCGRLGALFRIILPLSAPGLCTTAILVFISAWNEFLFALTYTSSIDHQTIPVGIALLPMSFQVPWGDMAAASVVATLPLILLVLILQRWIIQSLTSGALKG